MRNGFKAKLVHHPWASHIYTTYTIFDEGTYLVIDKAPPMEEVLSLRRIKFFGTCPSWHLTIKNPLSRCLVLSIEEEVWEEVLLGKGEQTCSLSSSLYFKITIS